MKKPSAWDRVVRIPYPLSHSRVYGMRASEVEQYHFEFTETWIEHMKKDILLDNYTSNLRFEPEKNMFIVRFECENVYETEVNIVIP